MRIISSFKNLPIPSSPPFFPIHTKSQTNPLILISLGRNLIENRNIFHPLDLSINEHTKHTIANVASANTSKQLWRCGTANQSERGGGGGRAERRSSDDTRTDDIRRGPAKFISRREYDRATRIAATRASASTGTRRDARTNIILSTRGDAARRRGLYARIEGGRSGRAASMRHVLHPDQIRRCRSAKIRAAYPTPAVMNYTAATPIIRNFPVL